MGWLIVVVTQLANNIDVHLCYILAIKKGQAGGREGLHIWTVPEEGLRSSPRCEAGPRPHAEGGARAGITERPENGRDTSMVLET